MESTTLGVIYGTISLLGLGFAAALCKEPTRVLKPIKLVFYRNLITSLVLFAILVTTGDIAVFSSKELGISFLISAFGFLPPFFFLKAVESGKMGLIAPVAYSSSLFSVIFAAIFYQENISPIQAIAILMIISEIVLSSIDFREIKKSNLLHVSSGVPYAFVASLGWGIFYFLYRIPSRTMGATFAAFLVEFIIMLIAFVIMLFKNEKFSVEKPSILRPIIILSILGAMGSLAYTQGLRVSDVSIVAPIGSATALVVVLYDRFVYHEHLRPNQYLASGLILAGIITLSFL